MSQRYFPHTYADPLLPWLPAIHAEQSQNKRKYCSVESTHGIVVEIETDAVYPVVKKKQIGLIQKL